MSVPRRRYVVTPRGTPLKQQQQQQGPSIETTPPAQGRGIAIVNSLSTSKPAVYSQRITSNNSAKKRTDTPPFHKEGPLSSQTSLTALQTREETSPTLPHSPPLSPSLYIQQELESLSADQISTGHTNMHVHTLTSNADILVSHSPDLHAHISFQTPHSCSDPHTSCPHSHTDDLHSHSDPQLLLTNRLLTNGIQEDTHTDETHSRSNGSHSCTDEPHNGTYKL